MADSSLISKVLVSDIQSIIENGQFLAHKVADALRSDYGNAFSYRNILSQYYYRLISNQKDKTAPILDVHASDKALPEKADRNFDEKKLEDASETLRIVRIGGYDACTCIGEHVTNTSEIGEFKILSHDFNEGVWRLR